MPTELAQCLAQRRLAEEEHAVDAVRDVTNYDNLYRLVGVTDPLSGVTGYSWDAVGNMPSLTDPAGNTTTWGYDNLDRATSETNELSDTRSWGYDAASNMTSATDRDGRVIEYDHDNLGRLVEERWMDGQTAVNTIDYVWDAASQLTSVSNDDSAYAYVFDNLGRVLSVDNAGTYDVPQVVLTMAYDANSRRTSVAAEIDSTDDFLNEYSYDNLGRMTRVEQSEQTGGNSVAEKRVDLAYNSLGQFSGITRYADIAGTDLVATTDYTYDSAHRLTALAQEYDLVHQDLTQWFRLVRSKKLGVSERLVPVISPSNPIIEPRPDETA